MKSTNNMIVGLPVRFLVEQPRQGCSHACSVGDIAHLLSELPRDDWESLQAVILRQPTRKQKILAPVWGRMIFHAELVTRKGQSVFSGTALMMEVVEPSSDVIWSRDLSLQAAAELERLREDGHSIVDSGKEIRIRTTLDSCRSTQLYRTVPHEIGHLVDWQKRVEIPGQIDPNNYSELAESYWSRPYQERESFANRYAAEARAQLFARGVIPFPRLERLEKSLI